MCNQAANKVVTDSPPSYHAEEGCGSCPALMGATRIVDAPASHFRRWHSCLQSGESFAGGDPFKEGRGSRSALTGARAAAVDGQVTDMKEDKGDNDDDEWEVVLGEGGEPVKGFLNDITWAPIFQNAQHPESSF